MSARQEAILRELNLHPLWRLREGHSAAHPAAEPVPSMPAQLVVAVERVAESAESHAVLENPAEAKAEKPSLADLGWPQLKDLVKNCTACKLRASCTQTVFGVGDEQADWLFVGEGPGEDEDAQGEPFVGHAGKLLDNMLAAIKLKRGDNVYIANIVKCRPPGNREPGADEIAQCLPYLAQQIKLIQPKLIVALGKTAAASLLGRDDALANLRGKPHDYHGIPLIITYHPAYLLRAPLEKAKAWQDFCLAVETIK